MRNRLKEAIAIKLIEKNKELPPYHPKFKLINECGDLADRFKVHIRTVEKWVHNLKQPNKHQLRILAAHYGMKMKDFYYNEENDL